MSEEIRNQAAPEAAVEEVEVTEETLNEQRRIRREKLKKLQEMQPQMMAASMEQSTKNPQRKVEGSAGSRQRPVPA